MSIKTTRDCSVAILGTGQSGCRSLKKYIERRLLIQKGYKFDKLNDTLTEEKVTELIQKGVIVPLPANIVAEPNHQEPLYETVGRTDMFVAGTVYSWIMRYPADKCLSRALESLHSKSWDLLEVDEDGELNLAETKDGFLKGFDISLSRYIGMTDNDGATSAKLGFRIQLTKIGSKEYDARWTSVTSDEVDWLNINGVDEVLLEQTLEDKLKVTFACDGTTGITGLTKTSFRVLDAAGASVDAFTINEEGDGRYALGGLTAGQDYTVYLYNSTLNANVISTGNYFYKSNRLIYTA